MTQRRRPCFKSSPGRCFYKIIYPFIAPDSFPNISSAILSTQCNYTITVPLSCPTQVSRPPPDRSMWLSWPPHSTKKLLSTRAGLNRTTRVCQGGKQRSHLDYDPSDHCFPKYPGQPYLTSAPLLVTRLPDKRRATLLMRAVCTVAAPSVTLLVFRQCEEVRHRLFTFYHNQED